ncbi:MAG: hypothetical protein HFJ41_03945 [Clostridia bacterium]|nr:hypothetical protein [Clostridia bacterium]
MLHIKNLEQENEEEKAIWIDLNGISYKADWKGIPAQPFLTPAYLHAKNTSEVEQEVIKSIQSDIRKLGSGK